jgi:hypothetical protein
LAGFIAACHPVGRVPIGEVFSVPASELQDLRLSYFSDSFSFVGEDEKGKVAFALDNNRGQDGVNFRPNIWFAFTMRKRVGSR